MSKNPGHEHNRILTNGQEEHFKQVIQRVLEEGAAPHTPEHVRQLAEAFGEEWATQVLRLPAVFQRVALAAGLARIESGPVRLWSEQTWLAFARGNPSWLMKAMPVRNWPHADADNAFEQAVLVLRDSGLWPWMLSPQESRDG